MRIPSVRSLRPLAPLALIVLVAFALRFWGIGFGLPNEHARPDERHVVGFTLRMGGNRLNPGFFNYPSLFLDALFAVYAAYCGLSMAIGRFVSGQDLVREYAVDPDMLYLLARGLVSLLGCGTVVLAYAIGVRLRDRRTGLAAAAVLACSYLHVRDSHFGTVDVPLAFTSTLALWMIVRASQNGSVRTLAWAAFCCGLAVSTKYNAVLLLVPLALSRLPLAGRPPLLIVRELKLSVALLALVVLGFLVATPYALLDRQQFIADVTFELVNKLRTPVFPDYGPVYSQYLSSTLPVAIGLLPLLAAPLGAWFGARGTNAREVLVVLAFPLTWFVVMGSSHVGFVRYALPMLPALAVLSGLACSALAALLDARFALDARRGGALFAGLVALLVAESLSRSVQLDQLLARTDTRVLARAWLEQNVARGASVGLVGSAYVRPELYSTIAQMQRQSATQGGQGRSLRTALVIEHVERSSPPSYEAFTYEDDARWHDAFARELTRDDGPEYVVVPEHPLLASLRIPLPELGPEYRQIADFRAFESPADHATYDWWDAFLLPFGSADGVLRPGPNLRVYRR